MRRNGVQFDHPWLERRWWNERAMGCGSLLERRLQVAVEAKREDGREREDPESLGYALLHVEHLGMR
jgi:hypothetical protein